MAQQQLKTAHRLDKVDPVWTRIRNEAEDVVRREPELASFIYSSILHHAVNLFPARRSSPTVPMRSHRDAIRRAATAR